MPLARASVINGSFNFDSITCRTAVRKGSPKRSPSEFINTDYRRFRIQCSHVPMPGRIDSFFCAVPDSSELELPRLTMEAKQTVRRMLLGSQVCTVESSAVEDGVLPVQIHQRTFNCGTPEDFKEVRTKGVYDDGDKNSSQADALEILKWRR